jgi:formylglycine-generating enzyme required for sulfatase activity
MKMKQWTLALHGPGGLLGILDSGESQFVLGSEDAADVLSYDLGGNAAEWVADLDADKKGPHFLRGGAWYGTGQGCLSSHKATQAADSADNGMGFRLVCPKK